ncbi:EAL domain-containing protein [Pusillimonas sp.]|uniref:EAL domain-containing protein n=1 Tax=Pusillimonas sp. TaxID=3040095 RepID=UPI0037CAFA45
MRKAHYWLLLKVAASPNAFIYGAGILVASTLILASVVATVWLDQSRVAQRHAESMQVFQVLSTESNTLLAHLVESHGSDCSLEALMHFNTHMLQSRYIREIGVLDNERRLICTTSLGILPIPIKDGHPVYTSRSGVELINNVPLAMADTDFLAVIMQRPPFNVVLSRYATGDIYSSADVVWLRVADGLVPLNVFGSEAVLSMRERAAEQTRPQFTLQGFSYEVITARPEHDLVLQTRRSLGAIFQESGALFAWLLAASLFIAALVVGTVRPYVIKLTALRNRIGFLCDGAHLTLAYQPIFDLTSLRPVGCEVLTRLEEGSRSWTPNTVIPAIQEAGLESQFDHAVSAKAIRELGAGLPPLEGGFFLALNCFPKSLRPCKLIPVLTQALQATARKDLQVCVEITEHSLSSELFTEVQQLKAEGFLIAVDDFGTGYSNLKTVTALSPDILKIDRSFAFELEDATLRSNLIPEIVNIAKAIGALTVAEGIEKPEQASLLAAAGVNYGQGYALAHPMELKEFLAFVAKYH